MNHFFRRCVALLILVMAPLAQAQLIDEVDFRREGANAVLQIHFVTPIQYRRALATKSGDVVQAFYDAVAVRNLPDLVVYERRIGASGGIPEIILTDDSAGRANLSRRLVIRFGKPVAFRVRAGRGDKLIEVVLEGLASALPSSTPGAQATPVPAGRFQIALANSGDPGARLDTPVPSSLQQYQVFTTKRKSGGKTVEELNLGFFDTEEEAERARQMLIERFPNATIVPVPGSGKPARTAAVAAATAASAAGDATAAPVVPDLSGGTGSSATDVESQAAALLEKAKAADAQQDHAFALARLNDLLELPPNASTREAQALAGDIRLRAGDLVRARAEYETFLKLYPSGADSDRVRQALARLPAPGEKSARRQKAPIEPTSTISGSISTFYFGGSSKIRTQEFEDSPISGLPQLASENTLAGTDQKQLLTSADFNWRYRDSDSDMRFVFRDAYTKDFLRSDKSRERLTALYFEHRSSLHGTSIKLGRQSPTGGGVLNRFDGVQAGYSFLPKWKVNAVVGKPTEDLLKSNRHFYGAWIDAEALTPSLSGSLYLNQQMIDSEVDRRGVGVELRYFSPSISVSGTVDYDTLLKDLNIASLQGTWQSPENTVVNVLVDRRATPILQLGNALFFGLPLPAPTDLDPNGTRLATSLKDLLRNGYTVGSLRHSVKATTTDTTQGLIAVTTPLNASWQVGGDVRVTNLGALPPIEDILPSGQGRSRNHSFGGQVIGTNLYSVRDTHVLSVSFMKGSSQSLNATSGNSTLSYTGQLISYNNSSQWSENWLFEPSMKLYFQKDNKGVKTSRYGPGLRVTFRAFKQLSLESELSGEYGKVTGRDRNEKSNRYFYYVGLRYDF